MLDGMESTVFDLKGFGESIARIRGYRDKSLRQVAEETGIARSTLHRIERGELANIHAITSIARWAALSLDHYGGLR